jgi:chromosome segregation ATPase
MITSNIILDNGIILSIESENPKLALPNYDKTPDFGIHQVRQSIESCCKRIDNLCIFNRVSHSISTEAVNIENMKNSKNILMKALGHLLGLIKALKDKVVKFFTSAFHKKIVAQAPQALTIIKGGSKPVEIGANANIIAEGVNGTLTTRNIQQGLDVLEEQRQLIDSQSKAISQLSENDGDNAVLKEELEDKAKQIKELEDKLEVLFEFKETTVKTEAEARKAAEEAIRNISAFEKLRVAQMAAIDRQEKSLNKLKQDLGQANNPIAYAFINRQIHSVEKAIRKLNESNCIKYSAAIDKEIARQLSANKTVKDSQIVKPENPKAPAKESTDSYRSFVPFLTEKYNIKNFF